MGFLLWRPQLLFELWDRVSSGNNRRTRGKNTLRTWQQAKPAGPGGRLALAKVQTKKRPLPIAPLRGAAQVDEDLETDTATPVRGTHLGPITREQVTVVTTSFFHCSRPGPPHHPLPSPISFRPVVGKTGRAKMRIGLGDELWEPEKKRWGAGAGTGHKHVPLKGADYFLSTLRTGLHCSGGLEVGFRMDFQPEGRRRRQRGQKPKVFL